MRSKRSAFRSVLFAGLMLPVGAAGAGATTFCVQDAGCVAAGGTAQPTIQNAIAAASVAAGPDRILLGPVTFAEGALNAAAGNQIELVGAGAGRTTIAPAAGTNVTTLTLADPGSTVSDLTVSLAAGTGETGLALGGTARRVTVTAADGTTGTGVSLAVGAVGSFLDGTVSLPTAGTLTGVSGNSTGTLANSSIAAATGVMNVTTVQRVRIDATASGIAVSAFSTAVTTTVDDALVRLVGNGVGTALSASGSGFGPFPAATLIARHVTAIGNGNTSSTGIRSSSFVSSSGTQTTSVTVSQAVLQGFGLDLSRTAGGFGSGANSVAQLTVAFSDLDPFKRVDSNTSFSGGMASGSINDGGGNFTAAPGFANAAGGDFSLAAGSALIDRGDPAAPAIGEPATDLAGNARVVDGDANGRAVADVGAFEFVPQPPAGNGPPPTGTQPLPPPPKPPTIDALSLTPARFAVGAGATAARRRPRQLAHGTTIHLTLSRAAGIALTVRGRAAGRRSGRACVKPSPRLRRARPCALVTVFKFTRSGRGGANGIAFSGRAGRRALPPGAYRLSAVATADGLASPPRTAGFTILRG